MGSLSITLSDLFSRYKSWVCKNPQTAGELESTIKWVSYFVAGKINNSIILTELVYSASNLLVLFNDIIILSAKYKINTDKDKIKIWLNVLEYSEVFMEISAKSVWGDKGKWFVVISVQLLKLSLKLILLLQFKEKIISYPAILPQRRNAIKVDTYNRAVDDTSRITKIAFTLKRSGRVIRKVNSAPPLQSRIWKPPYQESHGNNSEEEIKKTASQEHFIGEILYTVKPVITLITMLKFGEKTWTPWFVSAIADMASLYLLQMKSENQAINQCFTRTQKLELYRRRLSLLLYLMRSPFYEKHSKKKIISSLNSLSQNIPLARLICKPIQQYLPHWQETYFYLWSS